MDPTGGRLRSPGRLPGEARDGPLFFGLAGLILRFHPWLVEGPGEKMESMKRSRSPSETGSPGDLAGDPRLSALLAELEGRYELVRRLGGGGEGIVLEVRPRRGAAGALALKVVPGESLRPAERLHLGEEFRWLRRLSHPSIARVHDFGFLEGGRGVYFTSDLVAGQDLLSWGLEHPVDRDPAPWLSVARQALEALLTLEQAGAYHGDIKPSNLLVEEPPRSGGHPEPRLTLIDFGGAGQEGRPGLPGVRPRRTPLYLPAPESRVGGLRDDLFSLGLGLLHAAAGRLPFTIGDEEDHARWLDRSEPARLEELVPGAPPALARLIRDLTAPRADDRPGPRECLDHLHRSGVAAAEPLHLSTPPRVVGHERELDRLLEHLETPLGPTRTALVAIEGPPGAGKSAFVSEGIARAQLGGWQVIRTRLDAGSLELLPDASSGNGNRGGWLLDLLERLATHRILLVARLDPDSLPEPGWRDLLTELLRIRSPEFASRFILESHLPPDASREEFLPSGSPSAIELTPLDLEDTTRLVSLYFGAPAPGEEAIRRIREAARGRPARIWELLDRLREGGARVEGRGRVTLPENYPELLTHDLDASPGGDGEELVGLLQLAPGLALPASSWARIHGSADPVERVHRELERLAWRGHIERLEERSEPRYRAPEDHGPRPGEEGTEKIRGFAGRILEELDPENQPGKPVDPVADLVRAELLGKLDRPAEAARALFRSVRGTESPGRERRITELLDWLLASSNRERLTRPTRERLLLLSLRPGRPTSSRGPSAAADEHLDLEDLPARLELLVGSAKLSPESGTAGTARMEAIARKLREASKRLEVSSELHEAVELLIEASLLQLVSSREDQGPPRVDLETLDHRASSLLEAVKEPAPASLARLLTGAALGEWARVQADRGNLERALELDRQALELARQCRNRRREERVLHELATLEARHGNPDAAELSFRQCEKICRDLRDGPGALRAVVNRATLHYRTGRFDEAREAFEAAARESEALGPNRLRAPILMGLEVLARRRGDLLEALRLLRRLLRDRALLEPGTVENARFNLGEIYLSLGRLDRARAARREALELALRSGVPGRIARARVGLARVELESGELDLARRTLSEVSIQDLDARTRAPGSYLEGRLLVPGFPKTAREAFRHFRRSREAALRTGQESYVQLAEVGLLQSLVAAGHPGRATEIARYFGRSRKGRIDPRLLKVEGLPLLGEATRRTFLREIEGDPGSLLEEEVWQRAGPWERVRALALLLRREPAGQREETASLRGELEALILKLSRGLERPHLLQTHLLQNWLPGSSSAHGTGESAANDPGELAEEPTTLERLEALDRWLEEKNGNRDLASRESAEESESPGRAIEADLESLRQLLGSSSLALLNAPATPGPLVIRAPGSSPGDLVRHLGDARSVERVRESGKARVEPHFTLTRIERSGIDATGDAAPGSTPVLFVAWNQPATEAPSRRARATWSRHVARLLGYVLHQDELSERLREESDRRARVARELHELHARVLVEKSQLETALLSRRQESVALSRSLGEDELLREGVEALRSPSMLEILERIRRLAATDLPVLFTGEHGVGKDFLARLLHALGPRASAPFLGQGCEVPEGLLESELFGVTCGAFTGADSDREGVLVRGSGGTLYLDRIEDLPPLVQTRLLRAIEQGRVRPVGGSAEVEVDLRLVSSSLLDRRELAGRGGVQVDFLTRVSGEVIAIPPLRERREDIEPLTRLLLTRLAAEMRIPPPVPGKAALELLERGAWRGNLRELEIVLRRALLHSPRSLDPEQLEVELAETESIEGLPHFGLPGEGEPLPTLQEARGELEDRLIRVALGRCDGNATRAAEVLGVSRRHLGTLLSRYGIDPAAFKPS